MLFLPEMAPITYSFGFLAEAPTTVSGVLREWKREIRDDSSLTPVTGSLPDLLRKLEPLGAPWFKRLWVGTTSARWSTAYFDGSINGGDPFPPISYLAERIPCLGLVVVGSPQSVQIQEYGPDPTDWLNLRWAVAAANDDPWVWHHFGATREFEESSNYTNPRIKDRFTIDMLRRYCMALQVPLSVKEFHSDAMLESPVIPPGNHRFETLAEARARIGLGRAG